MFFYTEMKKIETNEEGDVQYVAEEVCFKADQTVTKEQIELSFDYMWADAEKEPATEPTDKERINALEDAMLALMG